MNLVYTYGGVVENNKDPLKLGRVKVRVPHVYGSTGGGSGFVATNDLPWALPAGMPAGGSARSGGFTQIPEVGDKVWVRFLDGEPEKPIWEWGMQSYADSKSLPLHSYKTGTDGSVGAPDRTAWTRYQHAIEMNAGGIIETTSGGYRLLLNDSATPTSFDGSIKLSTALGNMLEIDDFLSTCTLNILEDVNFQIGTSFLATSFDHTWNTTSDYSLNVGRDLAATAANNIDFSCVSDFTIDALAGITLNAGTTLSFVAGTDLTVSSTGLTHLTSTGPMTLDFPTLSLGTGSVEPFVLGNQMVEWMTTMLIWATSHFHTAPSSGGPTTPPTVPPVTVVFPVPAATISTTIFGR